jgi:hypothetical protein
MTDDERVCACTASVDVFSLRDETIETWSVLVGAQVEESVADGRLVVARYLDEDGAGVEGVAPGILPDCSGGGATCAAPPWSYCIAGAEAPAGTCLVSLPQAEAMAFLGGTHTGSIVETLGVAGVKDGVFFEELEVAPDESLERN